MARVPNVDAEGGLPFNIFKALNNAPQVVKGFSDLGGRLLMRGTLEARTRELVINAMSAKLDAPYEWSHHVGMARGVGVTDDELRAVRDGMVDLLPEPDRTCVAYALRVEDRAIGQPDVDGLRAVGLNDEQIVELTVLAGFYGMAARFLLAMDVELDEGNPGFDDL